MGVQASPPAATGAHADVARPSSHAIDVGTDSMTGKVNLLSPSHIERAHLPLQMRHNQLNHYAFRCLLGGVAG